MDRMKFFSTATAAVMAIGLSAQAATITATSDGNYNNAGTWDSATAPGALDEVIIDGFDVNMSAGVRIGIEAASPFNTGTGSVSVDNGSLTGSKDINMGFNNDGGGVDASLNIGANGFVSTNKMWVVSYDADAGANPHAAGMSTINFEEGGVLTWTAGWSSDTFGFRLVTDTNSASFTTATFEDLWDIGVITNSGQSGLTGATFSNYFVQSDAHAGTFRTLTAVPEPGSLALLGLGGLCMFRRRRG